MPHRRTWPKRAGDREIDSMTRTISAIATLLFLVPIGCSRSVDHEPAAPTTTGCEKGSATYYASSLAGHATASGEPYDPDAMTAASRTRRFGSLVRVSYQDRDVVVRINDRGPFTRGAIIDLSRAAAEQLGMVRAGRVDVRVCPLLCALTSSRA
jgi:rare lipoprotein A